MLSVNITAQNDLHEFSCPTKFLTYDENTLVFERNIREGLEENEEFSEVQNLYKRVLAIISKHLKDPKHPLFFLKTEYFHYFMKNYEYLTQMEFRTSTSKNMVACYETMLADIRQFIRLFKESIMNFYSLDEISKSSMQVNLFTNDNMINFVLSILFDDKVYFTIFEIQRKIDRFNEIILKRNLKNLKDFPPERFSVPEKFCLNEKTLISKNLKSKKKIPRTLISNICSPLLNIVNIECSLHKEKDRDHKQFTPFQNTIEMMKNLNYLKSPAHKMKLVIKASENIQDEIEEFYESYGVSEKIVLNPEEFLSIFIYIVSKVKINSLISQCNFMEKFMTQSNLTGKNGYYFYMFKAAVEYVLNETE